jgi:hypothetical protein
MSAIVAILAHSGDPAARTLAAAWPEGRARVLTPATLPSWGLSWQLGDGGIATCGAKPPGRGAPLNIGGVVSLLDAVGPADLPGVAPADRDYVASEMTAFLSAWLHSLRCLKLNPPSLVSLAGDMHPVLWRAHALECGMRAPPFDPFDDAAPAACEASADRIALTLIGRRAFGTLDAAAIARARVLAAATRLPMLAATMRLTSSGYALEAATARPDLADPDIAAAVVGWFEENAR